MDYCTAGPQYASGGFIADSRSPATRGQRLPAAVPGAQQLAGRLVATASGTRSSRASPARRRQSFPQPGSRTRRSPPRRRRARSRSCTSTRTATTSVFVPAVAADSLGRDLGRRPDARPLDPARRVLRRHARRQRRSRSTARWPAARTCCFTPGIYDVDKPIQVKRADTVVLGLGMATLDRRRTAPSAMTVPTCRASTIAGLHVRRRRRSSSPVLLRGRRQRRTARRRSRATRPRCRTCSSASAAPHVGKATVSLEVNSDDVILDDIWAWRADHGDGVGWTVEHRRHRRRRQRRRRHSPPACSSSTTRSTRWSGTASDGETIIFQNEMPYDPPNQAAWQHDGVLGFAGVQGRRRVTTHQGWGLGSYCFFNVDPSIHATRAFEVPVTPGVQLHDILDLSTQRRHDRPRRQRHGPADAARRHGQPAGLLPVERERRLAVDTSAGRRHARRMAFIETPAESPAVRGGPRGAGVRVQLRPRAGPPAGRRRGLEGPHGDGALQHGLAPLRARHAGGGAGDPLELLLPGPREGHAEPGVVHPGRDRRRARRRRPARRGRSGRDGLRGQGRDRRIVDHPGRRRRA